MECKTEAYLVHIFLQSKAVMDTFRHTNWTDQEIFFQISQAESCQSSTAVSNSYNASLNVLVDIPGNIDTVLFSLIHLICDTIHVWKGEVYT